MKGGTPRGARQGKIQRGSINFAKPGKQSGPALPWVEGKGPGTAKGKKKK